MAQRDRPPARRASPPALRPEQIAVLYEQYDSVTAYRVLTDLRARRGPQSAAGGLWEELGRERREDYAHPRDQSMPVVRIA